MLDGFQAIVQECIPWAKPSSKARSFWNSACRDTTQRAKRELKAYYRCRNTETRETLREAERAKVATIRREKTLCFRAAVYQASEDPRGVWALARWGKNKSMSPRALPKFPSLSRQDGTLAATFEEKVERLRETHFPAPLGADLEDIAEVEYLSPMPGGGDLTEAEVYSSMRRPSQDKAPGINGIPDRFLRAVYSELEEEIRHLFQGCFEIGYHPRKFKEANTVILKKPQKENYADPNSYRPIALLDTLGKMFETVIAARLRDCAEANNLLPEEQTGARQGRSVETALETITDAVHTV